MVERMLSKVINKETILYIVFGILNFCVKCFIISNIVIFKF